MGRLFEPKELAWYEKFLINIFKRGPVPKHIACIMDGNRRYLRKWQLEGDANPGSRKVEEVARWCMELGVKELTIFAFSIHNYKRGKEAVKELMDLIIANHEKVKNNLDDYRQNSLRIRVVGNLKRLPIKVQEIVEKLVDETKHNSEFTLNIALSYTFGDELTTSVKAIIDGVKSNSISVDDIDDQLVYDCLYTNFISKPDILIRTSGETRFSDFLLWQIEDARCYFIKPLWPEITLWRMLAIILNYQLHLKTNHSLDQLESPNDKEKSQIIQNFLTEVKSNNYFRK